MAADATLFAPPPEPSAIAPRPPDPPASSELVLLIERLATNPNVDVTKLEKLIEMQERILRYNAEAAFNAAFAEMQAEIPVIIERAKTDKTTYAPLEDIAEALRPILKKYGFSISHRTEWPDKVMIKIVGILTHREGHKRESEFLSVADQTGSKNAIQALGSTISYGRRYTTLDLLNITTRHEDDDGDRSEAKPKPEPPAGFEAWWAVLQPIADDGWDALRSAWNKSNKEFRDYLFAHYRRDWEALKRKAEQKKKGGAQ